MKNLLNLGKVLKKEEQQAINGGKAQRCSNPVCIADCAGNYSLRCEDGSIRNVVFCENPICPPC